MQVAASPALSLGPYTQDEATNDALVRNYFLNAGIPAEQIASVGSTYQMRGTGHAGEGETPPQLFQVSGLHRECNV